LNIREFQELKEGDRVVFTPKLDVYKEIIETQEENGGYLTVVGFLGVKYIGNELESFYTNIAVDELDRSIWFEAVERYEEPTRPWSYERDY
jgi:hypothetical protein